MTTFIYFKLLGIGQLISWNSYQNHFVKPKLEETLTHMHQLTVYSFYWSKLNKVYDQKWQMKENSDLLKDRRLYIVLYVIIMGVTTGEVGGCLIPPIFGCDTLLGPKQKKSDKIREMSCRTFHDVADPAFLNRSILPNTYKCFQFPH